MTNIVGQLCDTQRTNTWTGPRHQPVPRYYHRIFSWSDTLRPKLVPRCTNTWSNSLREQPVPRRTRTRSDSLQQNSTTTYRHKELHTPTNEYQHGPEPLNDTTTYSFNLNKIRAPLNVIALTITLTHLNEAHTSVLPL